MAENIPLSLTSISVSSMDNNCYLLHDSHEGLLIDAADDADALIAMADRVGVRITAVLTTHRHWDHVRALPEVLERTGARHYASYLDAPALSAPVDVELHNGDTLDFAGHILPVFILRGHTPGGACLAVKLDGKAALFVGDSLFPGGVGKTDSEADFLKLIDDVTTRVFNIFSDDSVVYPGHGKPTTLGAERPHLDEWHKRGW